ncbi:MFS transporter [Rhodopila sp.]|uniref:MFS transporter n=1 Tax=Rhodopila sp. TaxID=2480087 RepID=UPI003D132321
MTRGSLALNGLNFFTAGVQTGFGPFIAVWLSQQGWDFTAIGVALSIGTVAGLASQLPGGMLVDHIHAKRNVAAGGLIALGLGALLLCLPPSRLVVWASQVEHATASSVMTPVIAALTLSLCGHAAFSERLGVNTRYAALGTAATAAVLGGVASYTSERSVFILTAVLVLPALGSLLLIRPSDHLDPEGRHKALSPPHQREHPFWRIFADPPLHMFAIGVVLFQLANAALLPLALSGLTHRGGTPGYVVSASIVLPQLITAVLSPRAGALAQRIGRRPVLLAGFVAVPARALLFATLPSALPLIAIEALDGVSATMLGLMIPLIAADLTERTGYLNLAIGTFGLASGLGATFSTTIAGWLADRIDTQAAFLALAAVGAAGTVLLWLTMPETRPAPAGRSRLDQPAGA